MKILTVLTYYRPHTSGLTLYAQRLARALVRRGHEVTVLTSRFRPDLPLREDDGGVRVVRLPVVGRISKGVLMPSMGWAATRECLRHDLVHLHLPQFDAAGIALRCRAFRRPCVITYHCDLDLPDGRFNRFVGRVVRLANHVAARAARRIVVYTDDFAESSRFLRRYRDKWSVILPPVELAASADPALLEALAGSPPGSSEPRVPARGAHGARPIVGMATRFATEKGVEVLLDALPEIERHHPGVSVLFAGQHEGVWGEQSYRRRLAPRIAALQEQGRWRFLGVLDAEGMRAFYEAIDVLVVPSLNSTESFGLVQIEAMLCGTPVVASSLPGVRQPVTRTGMGRVVPVGDRDALAGAVVEILGGGATVEPPADALAAFAPDRCAVSYEALFDELLGREP